MTIARRVWSITLCLATGASVAAEMPVADFARHGQYQSVKISPNGEYLAASALVDGQVIGQSAAGAGAAKAAHGS